MHKKGSSFTTELKYGLAALLCAGCALGAATFMQFHRNVSSAHWLRSGPLWNVNPSSLSRYPSQYQPIPRGLVEALNASKLSKRQEVAIWKEERRAVYPEFSLFSPDLCPLESKHGRRVKMRLSQWNDPDYRANTGVWQDVVNNKIGQIFFVHHLANAFPDAGLTYPMVYACGEYEKQLLKDFKPAVSQSASGYVVKDLDGFSARGVYVLPQGFGGIELLSGKNMSREDVIKKLEKFEPKRVSIEEYIPKTTTSTVTVDYKFVMFGEKVLSINVAYNRGQPSACLGYFDAKWNRLDKFGCFYDDGGPERPGLRKPPKKSHQICGTIPKPELLPELIEAATLFGKNLGVFYRVDLFIHPGTNAVVLGEFTPWPFAGNYYCHATYDAIVGYDQCALGREWSTPTAIGIKKEYAGRVFEGGVGAIKPGWVDAFLNMSFSERCNKAVEFSRSTGHGMRREKQQQTKHDVEEN